VYRASVIVKIICKFKVALPGNAMPWIWASNWHAELAPPTIWFWILLILNTLFKNEKSRSVSLVLASECREVPGLFARGRKRVQLTLLLLLQPLLQSVHAIARSGTERECSIGMEDNISLFEMGIFIYFLNPDFFPFFIERELPLSN